MYFLNMLSDFAGADAAKSSAWKSSGLVVRF
jgi:hypothetical protein